MARRSAGDVFCFCGLRYDLQRAQTLQNYGRLFYGCPLYNESKSYRFFMWVDAVDGEANLGGKLTNNGDSTTQALQRQIIL